MAEAKAATYESIMKELRDGKYRPIYFLMGDEAYYIDKIAEYIAENALKPEERDFNQTVMYGADVTAAQIADAARRYPMMAERQVVIVKEAQNIKQTDALEKYVKQPMMSTVLVICHKNGKIDGRKKEYVKALAQHGVVFESVKLRDRELPAFIEDYMRGKNVAIDRKSTMMMADFVGADLSRLTGELDKLVLSLPENDRKVTPEAVEEQIGVSKEFNVYELRDAIVNKDVFKANQIINYFDKNPKSGGLYSVLPILYNYFQTLMIAYYAPNRNSQEALAEWLEFGKPWQAKAFMTGMRNYSGIKVLQIISKIREIDAKSKGLDNPNTPSEELMRELIFYILH